MLILGGIAEGGEIHRAAYFRPLTGRTEFLLSRKHVKHLSRPAWVSVVLSAVIKRIGTLEMSHALADSLSVADRIYLMLHLGASLNGDRMWLSPLCEACGERFDLPFKRSELPVKEGSGHPLGILLQESQRKVVFRTPNGSDQCWLNEGQPAGGIRALLFRCVLSVDGEEPDTEFIDSLSETDRGQLEKGVENASPDVDCAIPAKCPECGHVQILEFDPYWLGDEWEHSLTEEMHTLAYYYHWSETDILDLPRERRQHYVKLVDREGGKYV